MKKSAMIALYDQDQRKDLEYPRMRREVTPHVVRHVDTRQGGKGMVSYSRLSEANVEEAILEQVRYFESLGQGFEWKLYDYDQPPDLLDRLRSLGFEVEEEEAIMVLDLEDAPKKLWQPVSQAVDRITGPDRLQDVLAVQQQVWDEDFAWLGEYLRDMLRENPEQMSVYVAYVDQRPASAAWSYFPGHSRFASLWGGSTVNGFRKQGLYTALLAVRAQEAKDRRVRYLTVDASPMSRPILEKFGFEMIARSYPCTWNISSPEEGSRT